nr:chemotaxis protein CheC [Halorhabdus utahensis]
MDTTDQMPLLIDIRKLRVINQLIKAGAENAATSLGSLAGVESTVEIKSLAFVEPPDIAREIGTDPIYSASIRLNEPPYGVFLLTFYEETAREMAELLTGASVDDEFNQLQESALQEVCNILTSGFIDGIANTLGTTIDMGTPTLRFTGGEEIAEDALSHVRVDSLSIVLDSLVDVTDRDAAFKIRLFLIPDPGAFVNMLDQLELGEIDEDDTEADPVF